MKTILAQPGLAESLELWIQGNPGAAIFAGAAAIGAFFHFYG